MGFPKELCQESAIFLITVLRSSSTSPFVIAGTVYPHKIQKAGHGVFHSEFFDDFVVILLPVTYTLFAPTPSTQYPFFNLAFSISNLATVSRSRSNSESFLLVCSAANRFPGCLLGINACSPSARYSFTHLQIMLRSAVYSFSSALTETCSSRCLCTISAFCSGVHTRFLCPFFTFLTSTFILT